MKSRIKRSWNSLDENQRKHFIDVVMPHSRYKQYWRMYKKWFDDVDDLLSLASWLRTSLSKSSSEHIEEIIEDSKKHKIVENNLLHTESYYYDESRDVYVVHLPSKKRPFALSGEYWRSIRSSYSNWDDAPSSVNEISRKFSLSRRTVLELLRVMGMTHDSSPWTDEYMEHNNEEDLIKDLLRQKEERVLVKSQRRAWNKVKKDADKYRNISLFLEDLKLKFSALSSPYRIPEIDLQKPLKPFSLILSPTDFHWGKLATEYGSDPYNRIIAKTRLFDKTEEILKRTIVRGKPEKIFLAIGGDGLHIDNELKGTTRGTPQDCDGAPAELASSYVRLCIEYIEFVNFVCDVDVFIVPGNHDFYTSAILREAISAWFRNDDSVNVFDSLSPRQTFLYGKSLISFIHGDMGSVKDYPPILASENAELWGRSKWRFIFCGHLHTERELPQFGDTTIYRMPSIAGTDAWHFKKGYKSRKSLIGYIIDKELGVIGTEISPVE